MTSREYIQTILQEKINIYMQHIIRAKFLNSYIFIQIYLRFLYHNNFPFLLTRKALMQLLKFFSIYKQT